MAAVIESTATKDAVLTYVRHFWIASRTKATTIDLYKTIKREIRDKDAALSLSNDLHTSAQFYAALVNPENTLWNAYPPEIREDVRTLNKLNLVTVRPLILSGMERFKSDHATLRYFFRSLVNWSIRFLIAGKLGGGALEERYGDAARKVSSGKLVSIKQIRDELADIIPTDDAFRTLFETMTVTVVQLQRYYLRTLESVERKKLGTDDVGPVETKVNIEHVISKSSKKSFKQLQPETRKAYLNRLGNLALLNAKDNDKIGDEDYLVKRPVLLKSNMLLTAALAKTYDAWGTEQINSRQKELAKLALEAWPITVGGSL